MKFLFAICIFLFILPFTIAQDNSEIPNSEIVVPDTSMTSADALEVQNLLNNYYLEFKAENLDAYLATQYLGDLNQEEQDAKLQNVQKLFETFDTLSYNLDYKKITIEENYALLGYVISTTISNGQKNFDYTLPMYAILVKAEKSSEWKVYQVVPATVFESNMFVSKLDGLQELVNSTQETNPTVINNSDTPNEKTTEINTTETQVDETETNSNNTTPENTTNGTSTNPPNKSENSGIGKSPEPSVLSEIFKLITEFLGKILGLFSGQK
ncbi:MAG: hypothetical protein Q7K42_05890 [Candidatus Diapherotrites archaeon]|nr:hypothetical protein [Candidatus Diapherotrites archaeon]